MNWQFWLRHRPLPPQTGVDACNLIRPLLSLMGDGMASAKEVKAAEAHLQTCTDCQQAHLWIDATRQAICARPVVLPPADMRARIALAIAASAETALPAVPIAAPAVRRTFAVRPAYAAAASLALAGAFLGHYLLTSSPPSQSGEHTRPAQTASSGQGQTSTSSSVQPGVARPRLSRNLAKNLVATVPHIHSSVPNTAHGILKYPGSLSKTFAVSPADSGLNNPSTRTLQLAALRPPQSAPIAVVPNRRPSLVAKGPAVNPAAGVGVHPRSPAPQIAVLPSHTDSTPTSSATNPVSVPLVAVSTLPPAINVARIPDTPPAAVRSVPGDALSSVRVSLVSYSNTNYARRLPMASGVHERPNFVQGPIVYTPTSLSEENTARRVASSSPRPALVRTIAPSASSVPDAVLPATDQRRSEREKQWSDVPATGGA